MLASLGGAHPAPLALWLVMRMTLLMRTKRMMPAHIHAGPKNRMETLGDATVRVRKYGGLGVLLWSLVLGCGGRPSYPFARQRALTGSAVTRLGFKKGLPQSHFTHWIFHGSLKPCPFVTVPLLGYQRSLSKGWFAFSRF